MALLLFWLIVRLILKLKNNFRKNNEIVKKA